MEPQAWWLRLLRWILGFGDDRGGLTEAEFEEYEMLGEFMEWRRLSDEERERYGELHNRYVMGKQ